MSLVISLNTANAVVRASEFGGFDISTGTGEFEGDWSDWDDEPESPMPEEKENNDYAEEVRNYGQNMYDSASDDGYYENHTEQNWDVADEPEFPGTEDTSNVSDSGGIKNETPRVQGTERTENESMDVTEDTPTPEPTPEPTPTPTPVPVFTEVPQTEVSKITEYNEEYRLPPTECLQKMCLFYSKSELGKGENAEICLNTNIVQMILSVRINGHEKAWRSENGVLKIEGLEEEKNLLELALMIPKDLTWTESEKNVILPSLTVVR